MTYRMYEYCMTSNKNFNYLNPMVGIKQLQFVKEKIT